MASGIVTRVVLPANIDHGANAELDCRSLGIYMCVQTVLSAVICVATVLGYSSTRCILRAVGPSRPPSVPHS